MTAAKVIRDALEYLGPNGERWAENRLALSNGRRCVVTALSRAGFEIDHGYSLYSEANQLVGDEVGVLLLSEWNDDPHTDWSTVQLTLKRALHRAEEAGI